MIDSIWKLFPEALLAGGAVRSLYDNTEVEDYDFFMPSLSLMEYLWHNIEGHQNIVDKVLFKCPQKRLVSLLLKDGSKVQLIYIKDYSSPEELTGLFDFTVCCATKDIKGKIYFTPEFYRDVEGRMLNINTITYPMSTMKRMVKYVQKGYLVDSGVYKQLAKSILEANKEEELQDDEEGWSWYNSGSKWSFTGVD